MSLASASLSTFRACQDLTLDHLHDEFILSSKQNVVNALNRLPHFLGSLWFNCYLTSITSFFFKTGNSHFSFLFHPYIAM